MKVNAERLRLIRSGMSEALKVVLVGSAAVGKSALLSAYLVRLFPAITSE